MEDSSSRNNTSGRGTGGVRRSVARSGVRGGGTQVRSSRFRTSKLSSSSTRRDEGSSGWNQEKPRVTLDGVDVTPLSLVHARPRSTGSKGDHGAGGISDAQEDQVLKGGSDRVEGGGGGGGGEDETKGSRAGPDAAEDSAEGGAKSESKQQGGAADPTEEQLDQIYTVKLAETPTMTLLNIRGTRVWNEDKDVRTIVKANEDYAKLAKARDGNDNLSVRHAQTFNDAQKTKEVMVAPAATRDVGCSASVWEIFDAYAEDDKTGNDDDDAVGGVRKPSVAAAGAAENALFQAQVEQVVAASLASPGCLIDVEAPAPQVPSNHGGGHDEGGKGGHRGRGGGGGGAGGAGGPHASASGRSSRLAGDSGSHTHSQGSSTASHGGGGGGESGSAAGRHERQNDHGEDDEHRGTADVVDDVMAVREAARILASTELLGSLAVVERSISQNVYHSKHLLYRNVPDFGSATSNREEAVAETNEGDNSNAMGIGSSIGLALGAGGADAGLPGGAVGAEASISSAAGMSAAGLSADGVNGGDSKGDTSMFKGFGAHKQPSLELLWTFVCPATRGRNVATVVFNPHNSDLLAVTYGEFDFNKQRDGLLCFWSLKNPAYPQRVIHADCGITAAAWSNTHPNLIAAGYYDGTVAIFDTRQEGDKPVLESTQTSGKHTDAVWQVQWVQKPGRDGEAIVSISTDGRVTSWDVKKGITSSDLMVLKRIPNQYGLEGQKDTDKAEGILSRQASGLCFDFGTTDHNSYFAATEDGIVHKCSVSYNEQYLQSYFGHSGPVYGLNCSPFDDGVFLTCSADWTVKLWSEKSKQPDRPVMTFQSSDLTSDVYHVAWSPADASVFGSVTGDGRIQLWDLANPNPMDPVVSHVVEPTLPEVLAMERDDARERARAEEEAKTAAAQGLGLGGFGNLGMLAAGKKGGSDKEETPDVYATAVAAAAHVAQTSLGGHPTSSSGGEGGLNSSMGGLPGSGSGGFGVNSSQSGGEGETKTPSYVEVEGVLLPRGPKKLSCIQFSDNAPVIVVGDNTGGVGVYRMHGLQRPEFSTDEQRDRLQKAMFPEDAIGGSAAEADEKDTGAPASPGGGGANKRSSIAAQEGPRSPATEASSA